MQELPDNPSWLLKRAVRAFDKGHYRLAGWFCWIELCLWHPNDYFALCWYANSLYRLGRQNDHKAASLYERAIRVNPAHPFAHAGLGIIHYSNARRIHQEYSMFPGGDWLMFADEKSPEDSENEHRVSILTSHADAEVGNRKIAIKELEEAAGLTSDKDGKVWLLNMAAEVHTIMDNEAGIKAYKRVLDIAPDYVPAHFHLAGCYAATSYFDANLSGNRELALQEYKFIKENVPDGASDLAAVLARFGIEIDE